MTGPEHYAMAERLLKGVTLHGAHPDGSPIIRIDEPQAIAAAQVHATLALAAATALGRQGDGRTLPSKDAVAWFDAAAECRKRPAVTEIAERKAS